jgi:hypothetical protein
MHYSQNSSGKYLLFICFIVFTIFTFSHNKLQARTSTDTDDNAMKKLGRLHPQFQNIGRLSKVYTLPFGQQLTFLRGSAVYMGGHSCLSAGHCLSEKNTYFRKLRYYSNLIFPMHYQITFETSTTQKQSYKVERYVVHPAFESMEKSDIAILKLEKEVEHLKGLKPCYEFGTEPFDLPLDNYEHAIQNYNRYPYHLTYVGYGGSGNDTDLLEKFFNSDGKRRAARSILYSSTKKPDNLLYSWPHKSHLFVKSPDENQKPFITSRPPLPFELGLRPGMSGGATFDSFLQFIAINSAINNSYISDKDLLLCITRHFITNWSIPINISLSYASIKIKKRSVALIPFSLLWLCALKKPYAYTGSINVSVPLGPYEDWIEKHRKEFDGKNINH